MRKFPAPYNYRSSLCTRGAPAVLLWARACGGRPACAMWRLLLLRVALPALIAVPSHTSDAAAHWSNTSALLQDAASAMSAAANAILATHALDDSVSDINSRVVSPKPVPVPTDDSGIEALFISTNGLSRKVSEIRRHARANLAYYDSFGVGYVAMRGEATVLSAKEARREWWDGCAFLPGASWQSTPNRDSQRSFGSATHAHPHTRHACVRSWQPFFPEGANTSGYTVIRFAPDALELLSVDRSNVQSWRKDWLPVSLARRRPGGSWRVTVPPQPAPPSPPSPAGGWACTVCAHVYDAEKDGGGVPFEELPTDWKCPVCGAPKSAYRRRLVALQREGDGEAEGQTQVQWAHG